MSIFLHEERLSPSISLIRMYNRPDGYELELDYIGVCTILFDGNQAEVIGCKSDVMNSKVMRELKRLLRQRGVEYYEFRRGGRSNHRYTV